MVNLLSTSNQLLYEYIRVMFVVIFKNPMINLLTVQSGIMSFKTPMISFYQHVSIHYIPFHYFQFKFKFFICHKLNHTLYNVQ